MKKSLLTPVIALLSAALLLSGCQVRLDTPDPEELVPDAAEQARSGAVADSLAIAAAADYLLSSPDDVLAPVLMAISADSTQHVEALGGVYESGLPTPEADEEESPTPEPALGSDATVDSLIADLQAAAETNFTVALSQDSAEQFHLYGAIGVAQAVAADRLTVITGGEVSEIGPAVFPSTVSVPESTRDSLILAEDQLGYLYEFLAARSGISPQDSSDEVVASAAALRAQLLGLSRIHTDRAEQWAAAGNISNTVADPREATYALPTEVDEASIPHADALLADLVPIYSLHAFQAGADQREVSLDLWLLISLEASRTGSELGAFPGR